MKYYNESNRLQRYLNVNSEDKHEEKISDLLSFTERYLNLVTLQRERLQTFEELRDSMDGGRVTNPEHLKAIRLYFGDIHFFFNCIHKFLLFSQRLMKLMNIQYSDDIKSTEKYYRTIRNHFEHVDERIEKHPFYRMDFSSISENGITIDGVNYGLSEKTLPPLYYIYDNIIISIDSMIKPRKEGIDRFLQVMEQHLENGQNEESEYRD